MANILFVTLGAHGHVRPVLPIVEELRRRGHRVVVAASKGLSALFEAKASETIAYDSLIETFHPSIVSLSEECFPIALLREGIVAYSQILSALDNYGRPDLIVFDSSTIASKWIARKLGIKSVGYNVAYASTDQCSFYDKYLEDFHNNASALEMFRNEAEAFASQAGVGSIEPEDTFLCTEEKNLVFMSREFHPRQEELGEDFEFVGPTWENARTEPVPDGAGIVYISLGTIFYRVPEFYRHCIEAFAGTGKQVVITCPDSQWPTSVPENIQFVPFVDSIEMLSKACVFLTHGGMNAVQEAISLEVPMVVVPQYMDQFITAGQIQKLGLGVHLPMESVTAQSIIEAVRSVTSAPSFTSNLRLMANHGRNGGGCSRAASLIEGSL